MMIHPSRKPRFRYLAGALAIAGAAVLAPAISAAPTAHAESCSDGWSISPVATDLGGLESLEPDGAGGFYVSGFTTGKIYHVDTHGKATVLLHGLDVPTGVRRVGNDLYFLTGNNFLDGLQQKPIGVLQRLDLTTGQVDTLATGLLAPNGLLVLPDGDLLISQLAMPGVGTSTGITRYRMATGEVIKNWAPVPSGNGLGFTPGRDAVYTTNTFTGELYRIPLAAPTEWTVQAHSSGLLPGPDDFQVTTDGSIYLALHYAGKVVRFDPNTDATCTLAEDLLTLSYPPGPSSVRAFGSALYVTAFDGTLYRLQPPPGTNLTPA